MLEVKGKVRYQRADEEEVSLKGKIEIPEDTSYHSFSADGKVDFGILKSDQQIRLRGKFEGDEIVAKILTLKGEMNVKRIQTDEAGISFSGQSSCGSIVAEAVRIEPLENDQEGMKVASVILGSIFKIKIPEFPHSSKLPDPYIHIDSIKAKKVEINGCVVDKVICEDAIIRGQCKIGSLTYGGTIKVDEASTISERKQFSFAKE